MVGHLAFIGLERQAIRIPTHDVLEPLGYGLLDLVGLKLGKLSGGMETSSADHLLFGRKMHNSAVRID
jgi:hypothetical protein